jgi:diacylglycerol kinase (ATP)
MNNKPKYTIFKNAKYAIEGLVHAVKTETSFKIELLFSIIFFPVVYFLPILFLYKLILIVTFF